MGVNFQEEGAMLEGQVVLITGAAGRVAFPIARKLGEHNKVYGMARFSKAADRDRLAAQSIVPIRKDLAGSDFRDLPNDNGSRAEYVE